MEEIITKNDHFKITQNEFYDKMYTIFFPSYNEPLIKSIIKPKILLGATTTEKYNTISFKATKVQTFKEYQIDLERENGTKKLQYNSILKMTYNLATQLNFLITNYAKTFLGYSPENLIVVDKNKYIYLSSEYLLNISNEHCGLGAHFTTANIKKHINEVDWQLKHVISYIFIFIFGFSGIFLLILKSKLTNKFYFINTNLFLVLIFCSLPGLILFFSSCR